VATYQEWIEAEAERANNEEWHRRRNEEFGAVDEATIRMVEQLDAWTLAAIADCQQKLDDMESCACRTSRWDNPPCSQRGG